MTATPIDPDEIPDEMTEDRLHNALVEFTGCVGEALDGLCSYGLTIGQSYVPFNPDPEDDCEDEEAYCSQAWVRVENVSVANLGDSFDGSDCGGELTLSLEVGVLRCVEIPEDGEAPTASDVLVSALQAMDDMRAIYCAAMSCEVWESINVGQWVPNGPQGGQVGGIWTFTVSI